MYFVYGNQSLELEEEINKLIASLLPKENLSDSVFHFDLGDFFPPDSGRSEKLLCEVKNTCETVSFFSPVIVVHFKNLQRVPVKKSPTESVDEDLRNVNLVKAPLKGEPVWFDADTLTREIQTRHCVTGKQIVTQIVHLRGKQFFLRLDSAWENRLIHLQKGDAFEAVQVKEYLVSRLKSNVVFDLPPETCGTTEIQQSAVVALLNDYLSTPPSQVEIIFSATIRNPRELNQQLYKKIKARAKEIKTTVAYDDFRPISWVMSRAREKGVTLNQQSADLLIEIAGVDYSVLDMELRKLSIRFPGQTEITPDMLINNVSQSKRFSIFRVADFIVRKELKKGLESLRLILKDNPSDSVVVFSLIASQFRRLLKISWMRDSGMLEKNIVGALRINQWVAKQAMLHANNFTLRELENIVVYLSKRDLQIKFSSRESLTILENICFQICQGEFQTEKAIARNWVP